MDAADRSMVQAMIDAAVHEAVNRALRDHRIPGYVQSSSGSTCLVEPDDNPGTTIQATRMSGTISAGDRVLLWFPSDGGIYAFGAIPTS